MLLYLYYSSMRRWAFSFSGQFHHCFRNYCATHPSGIYIHPSRIPTKGPACKFVRQLPPTHLPPASDLPNNHNEKYSYSPDARSLEPFPHKERKIKMASRFSRKSKNQLKEQLAKYERMTMILDALGDLSCVPSASEIKDTRKKFLAKNPYGTRNHDSRVMQVLHSKDAAEYGQAYSRFLLENDWMDLGTLIHAATCLFALKMKQPEKLDIDLVNRILSKFQPLMDGNSVLTPYNILLLCAVGKWREALNHLEKVSDEKGKGKLVNPCAISAFHEGEATLGFKILRSLRAVDANVWDETQLAIIQHANTVLDQKNVELAEKLIIKMLKLLGDFHVYPNERTVDLIEKFFERLQSEKNGPEYDMIRTSVESSTGNCLACNLRLNPVFIHPDEYKSLEEGVLKYIIKSDNEYKFTDPEEREKFLGFMEKSPHFDLVIDGLNVFYRFPKVMLSNLEKLNWLADVLETVVEGKHGQKRFGRVLLIARDHIFSHAHGKHARRMAEISERMRRMATIFLLKKGTQDDGFFLYAAVRNGMQGRTWLMTNDRFSNEFKTLKDAGEFELENILRRYLAKRQLCFSMETRGCIPKILFPIKHEVVTQVDVEGERWHVPFDDGSEKYFYEYPNDWLCIRKRGVKT